MWPDDEEDLYFEQMDDPGPEETAERMRWLRDTQPYDEPLSFQEQLNNRR